MVCEEIRQIESSIGLGNMYLKTLNALLGDNVETGEAGDELGDWVPLQSVHVKIVFSVRQTG